jgi:hypothetical protein
LSSGTFILAGDASATTTPPEDKPTLLFTRQAHRSAAPHSPATGAAAGERGDQRSGRRQSEGRGAPPFSPLGSSFPVILLLSDNLFCNRVFVYFDVIDLLVNFNNLY